MIRRPPRSTLSSSSAASDVYKRQVLSHEHISKMQLNNNSGVDPLLTLHCISIFPPTLLPSLSSPVPSFLSPPFSPLFPSSFNSRFPSLWTTKRSAHGYGSWRALKIPQRVRAEPGRQTHFGAFQFKIFALDVATHSLFGRISPNHHSVFGARGQVIGVPISPNRVSLSLMLMD